MEEQSDFSDKFKEIFDLCDVDKDGYIDVKHFQELAQDHFGAASPEELTGITQLLDPDGRGQISYKEFCQGVQQILEIQGARPDFKASVSEETLVPLDIAGDVQSSLDSLKSTLTGPSPSASQITFSEYDLNGLEDLSGLSGFSGAENSPPFTPSSGLLPGLTSTPLLIPLHSEDEADSALSGKSSEINESSRQEITDEENYEDFGEMESSEADASDQGHLTPSTKRKSDRRDPLSRHHHRKTNNRRLLTTAALASQLQRSGRASPSSSRRSSLGSNEIFEDIDGNFQDVNGRLAFLEEQLQNLTQQHSETNHKQGKLKDENSLLVHKVHYLEEQLSVMEVRADDRMKDEQRKHSDFMSRQERDKNEQVEYITQRLHKIEREYEELKEEAPRLRNEVQKMRTEKMDIQERLLERQENYNQLYEEHEKLKSDYKRQDTLQQKERHTTGQLLDEMGKELEELRRFKMAADGGSRSPTEFSEPEGRYRDLQGEIHKLKEENRHLHDSNEELNAQLMTKCIGEGRALIKDTGGQSLAQELEHLTKEELLEQLKIERDVNHRLKQYVDRIICVILEKNPSLLEITMAQR